jgi:putative hydrolase of the HAD superfamily
MKIGRSDVMKAGIKAILFDLDETLLDASSAFQIVYRVIAGHLERYFEERGVQVSRQKIYEALKKLSSEMNLATNYDRNTWWPILFRKLDVSLKPSSKLIQELTSLYWNSYIRESKPYPDAEDTLTYLRDKGYKLGIITDTDSIKGTKEGRLRKLNLKFFDIIVIGGEGTAENKRSPQPFRLAAKKLGLRPEECAFVGDKPFTDIRGAKLAGMMAILVKRKTWDKGEKPDLEINSLSELREIF